MGHPSARDWRMAMKFGQLHLFENPMDRSEKEIVDEQFDIMARAEEFGFDSVWPAEHHFSEYGYCASPAVTLAALSGGRVDLGVGRGYQPHEFAGFGVDQERSRDIFRESVEVIQQAWTRERFSYEGEFYRVNDLSVRPKPLQKPHPPIWMASLSSHAFELCGRYGFNLMCAPVFGFNVNTGAALIEQGRAV